MLVWFAAKNLFTKYFKGERKKNISGKKTIMKRNMDLTTQASILPQTDYTVSRQPGSVPNNNMAVSSCLYCGSHLVTSSTKARAWHIYCHQKSHFLKY